jgi:prepilin-type N-terminal cleavage/methylation domain-containing protein
MKKSAAFTLIELLVVIAIIAILASIALPVFSKVLEKGRVTQDCSNLRQIGIGTVAYLNDNNETLFNAGSTLTDPNNAGKTYGPPALLEIGYVPNPKVFQSPFDKRIGGTPNPLSYGVNSNLLVPTNASPPWDSNWTKLAAASQLVLYAPAYSNTVADPSTMTWPGKENVGLAVPPGGTGAGGVSMMTGTHQNYKWIDVLYADMHVVNVKFTDFQSIVDNSKTGGVDGVNQWQPMGHTPP